MLDKHPFIIAEIGINHDGDIQKANRLIEAAASSRVDAVKFQYRNIKNAYRDGNLEEIGDEIVSEQIIKCFLSPDEIINLTQRAKVLGMHAGISFFDEADIRDFGEKIEIFDFFKIPSSELTHRKLTGALLTHGKDVLISTGCHDEAEIFEALDKLDGVNWTPLHCVSNYPVSLDNAKLGYIRHLQKLWKRPVGYSSHDTDWEVSLIALSMGASIIERHITFDKSGLGLDHSSSSTPDEFEKLVNFAKNIDATLMGEGPRFLNQGERINRQNLGRSLYAKKSIKAGDSLDLKNFNYRAPYIGLNHSSIKKYIGRPLLRALAEGEPILGSHFENSTDLSHEVINFADEKKIGIPVRYHDFASLKEKIPVRTFEFHLSQHDLEQSVPLEAITPQMNISVHLPDYVRSDMLLDPFSNNKTQRAASHKCLELASDVVHRIQDHLSKEVPFVASLPMPSTPSPSRIEFLTKLIEDMRLKGIALYPQWLPPVAWYFGGSVKLNFFNGELDMKNIRNQGIQFCFDVSHYILSANRFGLAKIGVVEQLLPHIKHIHLSDAAGLDGEGLQLGDGEVENRQLIQDTLTVDVYKIIEVWQGHLNEGEGFKEMLNRLFAASLPEGA